MPGRDGPARGAAIESEGALAVASREGGSLLPRSQSATRARRRSGPPAPPEWVELGSKQKRCLEAIYEIYAGQWVSNHSTRCMMRIDWVHFCKDVLHVRRPHSNCRFESRAAIWTARRFRLSNCWRKPLCHRPCGCPTALLCVGYAFDISLLCDARPIVPAFVPNCVRLADALSSPDRKCRR